MVYVTQNSTTRNGMRDAETLPRVHMWDVEAKENQHRLLGHTDTIMWVATSPNSTLVASVSWDGTAGIWCEYDFTTNTKQQFARRPGCQLERGSASKPVCTADSSLLVVSDADGAVRFWRLCERVCIYI
ncbi:hypothetical protein BDV30DRAFT_170990 [Aspergillus minisclerotigenes]|uniref:WD40-repeat-containing domain protein n=1 Tax=Aspergillus minisclerotigenes TaxID=656917 RepID=A0A5N6JH55_9EURO|nr:hypothetical protein BDV30DRAFT_170990 [Aspergillus minisclerotigenes]